MSRRLPTFFQTPRASLWQNQNPLGTLPQANARPGGFPGQVTQGSIKTRTSFPPKPPNEAFGGPKTRRAADSSGCRGFRGLHAFIGQTGLSPARLPLACGCSQKALQGMVRALQGAGLSRLAKLISRGLVCALAAFRAPRNTGFRVMPGYFDERPCNRKKRRLALRDGPGPARHWTGCPANPEITGESQTGPAPGSPIQTASFPIPQTRELQAWAQPSHSRTTAS